MRIEIIVLALLFTSISDVSPLSFNRGYTQPSSKQGAYELAASSKLKLPIIILVSPFLDANIGSVARAMLNFGLHELRKNVFLILCPLLCTNHLNTARPRRS